MKCSRCLKTITKSSKSDVGVSVKGKSQSFCVECGDLIWSQRTYAVPITQEEVRQEPQKTLRDEFAMAAMASLILKTPSVRIFDSDENMDAKIAWSKERFMPGIAAGAYGYADAMLAARNQSILPTPNE